jgi:hypothetical protein
VRRFLPLILGACIVAAPGAAGQAPDDGGLETCRLIQDDAARLNCFDRMSPPVQSGGASSEPRETPKLDKPTPQERFNLRAIEDLLNAPVLGRMFGSADAKAGTWQIKAGNLGAVSDVRGTLESTDGASVLTLGCQNQVIEAAVTMRHFLGWESVRVVYRIGNGPAIEGRWAATDGRGAVISSSDAIGFLNALFDDAILSVSAFDYDEAGHSAKFKLGTVSNLRSQIALACGWSEPSAAEGTREQPMQPQAVPRSSLTVGSPLQLN